MTLAGYAAELNRSSKRGSTSNNPTNIVMREK